MCGFSCRRPPRASRSPGTRPAPSPARKKRRPRHDNGIITRSGPGSRSPGLHRAKVRRTPHRPARSSPGAAGSQGRTNPPARGRQPEHDSGPGRHRSPQELSSPWSSTALAPPPGSSPAPASGSPLGPPPSGTTQPPTPGPSPLTAYDHRGHRTSCTSRAPAQPNAGHGAARAHQRPGTGRSKNAVPTRRPMLSPESNGVSPSHLPGRLPQPAARLTSSAIRSSTSPVTSLSANPVAHIEPSSSRAASLKPRVA